MSAVNHNSRWRRNDIEKDSTEQRRQRNDRHQARDGQLSLGGAETERSRGMNVKEESKADFQAAADFPHLGLLLADHSC